MSHGWWIIQFIPMDIVRPLAKDARLEQVRKNKLGSSKGVVICANSEFAAFSRSTQQKAQYRPSMQYFLASPLHTPLSVRQP